MDPDILAASCSTFGPTHSLLWDFIHSVTKVKYLSDGSILLTQSEYIQDLLNRANMLTCSAINTPMVANIKPSHHGTDKISNPSQYRSTVGALQYITLNCSELAYNVNKVCQSKESESLEKK